MHAGSLEALWVTQPEAVGLEGTKLNFGGIDMMVDANNEATNFIRA
jgi:hypothetical protein